MKYIVSSYLQLVDHAKSNTNVSVNETSHTYLQVCRISVALVRGCLQFLHDPALQLVGIALEVHESPCVLQTLSAQARSLLEGMVAAEDLLSALLDVLGSLQDLDLARRGLVRHLATFVSSASGSGYLKHINTITQ